MTPEQLGFDGEPASKPASRQRRKPASRQAERWCARCGRHYPAAVCPRGHETEDVPSGGWAVSTADPAAPRCSRCKTPLSGNDLARIGNVVDVGKTGRCWPCASLPRVNGTVHRNAT